MKWKDDALSHAKQDDPKESVGLLINKKGKKIYIPCKNESSDFDSFILNPNDYLNAEKKGEIIAVIHSHPLTPPIASQADKVSCENTNLPWYIVNPKTEQWGYIEPCGYKAPILGREYVWGITDCWSYELKKDEKLKNNDALLMSIGGVGLNHVAIFVDGDVVHHLSDRLSCKEPYNEWLLKCTGKRLRYVK